MVILTAVLQLELLPVSPSCLLLLLPFLLVPVECAERSLEERYRELIPLAKRRGSSVGITVSGRVVERALMKAAALLLLMVALALVLLETRLEILDEIPSLI